VLRHERDPVAELLLEPSAGLGRFPLDQRRHDDPPRLQPLGDVSAHLEADEPRAAEDQEVMVHALSVEPARLTRTVERPPC
jgi:hypothetical protein